MAFGLLKRSISYTPESSKSVPLSTTSKHIRRTGALRHNDVLGSEPHQDATECTTDREDEDGSHGSGLIAESTSSDPRVVELQDDLRAKAAQVSVLRDTLTNLSHQMREQTSLLEQSRTTIGEKDDKISSLTLSLEQVKIQLQQSKRENVSLDQEWKEKYNDLERILDRAVEEKDQWKIRFEELQFDQDDALLGKKQLAQPQAHSLWSDDEDEDEKKVTSASSPRAGFIINKNKNTIKNNKNQNKTNINDDMAEMLIGDDYDEAFLWGEPDTPSVATPAAAMDVAMRPPAFTNRPGPFRRKKQRPAVKPFQTKPMEWILTSSSSSENNNNSSKGGGDRADSVEPSTLRTVGPNSKVEDFEQENVSDDDDDDEDADIYLSKRSLLTDAVSRAVSELSDVKARARRVRRAAKKESAQAGFDIQKVEC